MSDKITVTGKDKILKALKDPSLVEIGGYKRFVDGEKVYFGEFKKIEEVKPKVEKQTALKGS